MLCFSNFKWNFELSYKFASLAKQRDPNIIIIFGGPNFPIDINEKIEFLKKRPVIDFVVELEGELGFDFFHYKEQQEYISNQIKLYSAHEGMGRMLLQSDIRLFFRSFSRSC